MGAAASYLLGPYFPPLAKDPSAALSGVTAVVAPSDVQLKLKEGAAYDNPTGGIKASATLGESDRRTTNAEVVGEIITHFDKTRVLYGEQDLSPLSFEAPAFWTYMLAMLAGAFKVAQYIVTMLVALMVAQYQLQSYWSSHSDESSGWRNLLIAIFIWYPFSTLSLLIIISNEMAVRKFLYYRLMSMQVLIDFEDVPLGRTWFLFYFVCSSVVLVVWSLWAAIVTRTDATASVFPQFAIMISQTLLLFSFWWNLKSTEDMLVSLNNFIESAPHAAKELISKFAVVRESHLRAVMGDTLARYSAFKRLSTAEQAAAIEALPAESPAALFNLAELRRRRNRPEENAELQAVREKTLGRTAVTGEQVKLKAWEHCKALCHYCVWGFWVGLCARVYATLFIFRVMLHRSASNKRGYMWPFVGDMPYFFGLWLMSTVTLAVVLAVEAYAIYLIITGMNRDNKYGINECKKCYQYQYAAASSCAKQPMSDPCYGVMQRGYCALRNLLTLGYSMNATQVDTLTNGTCQQLAGNFAV